MDRRCCAAYTAVRALAPVMRMSSEHVAVPARWAPARQCTITLLSRFNASSTKSKSGVRKRKSWPWSPRVGAFRHHSAIGKRRYWMDVRRKIMIAPQGIVARLHSRAAPTLLETHLDTSSFKEKWVVGCAVHNVRYVRLVKDAARLCCIDVAAIQHTMRSARVAVYCIERCVPPRRCAAQRRR